MAATSIRIKTKGTKEWADTNVNIYYGCSNNCKYCYAKKMWEHYRKPRGSPPIQWDKMILNEKAFRKGYRKRGGRIMFPTSHDITKESHVNCKTTLEKLLRAGNDVLLTTKPDFKSLTEIMEMCQKPKYKRQVQFRFTITSISNAMLKEWEPNAPRRENRMKVLKEAYLGKFKTSVSIEPFLDKDPVPLIKLVAQYCTESIWLGIMSGQSYIYHNFENLKSVLENICKLPDDIRKKIRLKDSIRNMRLE